jgi:DNA-binding NtrC family response regulator
MRLILVDDDRDVLRSLEMALKRHFSVVPFQSAREALEYVRSGGSVDAVLTDVDMRPMDGIVLGQEIARVNSGLRVFYMSGRDVPLPEPNVCFAKPFEVRQAAKLIQLVVQSDAVIREMKESGVTVDMSVVEKLQEQGEREARGT